MSQILSDTSISFSFDKESDQQDAEDEDDWIPKRY
jgi:hypothetical protein